MNHFYVAYSKNDKEHEFVYDCHNVSEEEIVKILQVIIARFNKQIDDKTK